MVRPLTIPGTPRKIRGLEMSGRLDLNQRPLAPQAAPDPVQPLSNLPNSSDSFVSPSPLDVQRSQGVSTIPTHFATTLLPPIEQLFTVGHVARLLGVCRATVYKWAADGVLPHVRIVNVIRIRGEDLNHALHLLGVGYGGPGRHTPRRIRLCRRRRCGSKWRE